MPTKCVISDCKSGKEKSKEDSEPESVQTFLFPTETRAKNRWLRQCDLGKNIGKNSRLCAKHFQKGCFLSPSENVDDCGRSRTKLRLKDEAVPTIFNFGPSPSKRRASKRFSTEVTPVLRKVQRIDHNYSLDLPQPAVVSNNVVNFEHRYVPCPHFSSLHIYLLKFHCIIFELIRQIIICLRR